MNAPLPVPLEVDADTGVWSSDGQPMILIPRRFWVFVQMEAERMFGIDGAQRLYEAATRRAAAVWCQEEARRSGDSGAVVFERYLGRVSRRGMGRFSIRSLDPEQGRAQVELQHSIFVAEYGKAQDRCVCYSFAAALAGAMEFVRTDRGLEAMDLAAEESECQARGDPICRFEVRPATR